MRSLTVFLFFFVALASAAVVHEQHPSKPADATFLKKQRGIFELLYHVHQPNIHEDQVSTSKSYSIEAHKDQYNDPKVVDTFMKVYRSGFLPKLRSFAISNPKLFRETKVVFDLMYSAKDWDTFFKTACWAREHINEQMFVYTLSIAVLHRKDCEGVILPPPYEILPYYFFPTEVIDLAYKVKMQGNGKHISDHVEQKEKIVTIKSDYPDWNINYNQEERLSYFTEDIGLNTYYYYYLLSYASWLDGHKYGLDKDHRGRLLYWVNKQLLARYYLERLSNGLGEIPTFSWDQPIETGFHPNIKQINGMEFPDRPNHYDLRHEEFLVNRINVKDYERRIRDAIDLGYVITPEGHVNLTSPKDMEILASIVENFPENPNRHFYKYSTVIPRKLLGNSPTPLDSHNILPSVLELPQTCTRDPVFYQLIKRYVRLMQRFTNTLTPYTKEELSCPGVKIESVDVGSLVTYFDHQDVDISNVVFQTPEEVKNKEDDLHITVRQTRLNHLPFTVTTNVMSEKATKVVFKIFLGPKYDGKGNKISIPENRENFVWVDEFVYELKSGKNVVERSSKDFWTTTPDFTSSNKLYKNVVAAMSGTKKFMLDNTEEHDSFPDRLLLPKGRKGGMPFMIYVIVSPYHPPKVPYGTGFDPAISTGLGSGATKLDASTHGFPFDRPIHESVNFKMTNMHWEDVVVYHKKETEINKATHD